MKKKIIIPAVLFAVLALAGCGKNDASNNPSDNKQQKDAPSVVSPPENEKGKNNFVDSACKGKSEGDSCEMSLPQENGEKNSGKAPGICRKDPADQLFCMPQNNPQGQGLQDQNMQIQAPGQE